eukprot:5692208-Ditylum_brightwellii.AAC.2
MYTVYTEAHTSDDLLGANSRAQGDDYNLFSSIIYWHFKYLIFYRIIPNIGAVELFTLFSTPPGAHSSAPMKD